MSALSKFLDGVFARLRLLSLRMVSQVGFWGLALTIGIASGIAAVLFGTGIILIQTWVHGTPDVYRLHSFAETLDWYWVMLIPTIGGV
jgi:CIC family chloride channel protein